MIRIFRNLVIAALLSSPLALGAQEFEDGKHYRTLDEPVPTSVEDGTVEVVEIFWYGCPHCFRLEPEIDVWLEHSKPDYVELVRLPAVLNKSWELHARAFYVAEALGVVDELHGPLFKEIHFERRPLDTEDRLRRFFVRSGVSEEDFDEAFASFEVDMKLRRANELVRKYGVTGTPALVIDGKYVTNGTMAGSYEALFEIVNFLAEKERT